MNFELFGEILERAVAAIKEPRFYETERGYQGELIGAIKADLRKAGFPNDPIVEQEYQKTVGGHGTRIRPDIIIHVPFERKLTDSRKLGNFVAIEIKRRATEAEAAADLESLAILKEKLNYPITIFINIDSDKTYSNLCPRSIASQTKCYAVKLIDGTPKIVCE